MQSLRLHGFLPASFANGPGRRAVLWVQGCTLGCPGCFNPETHPFGGTPTPVDDLVARMVAGNVEGVTVSGGEPLQQRRPLAALLARIKIETDLSVLVFTGYSWDEAQRFADVLASVDVLLTGRYRPDRPKRVHFLTDRYSQADLDAVPPAEVIIEPDGSVAVTGMDPPMTRTGLHRPAHLAVGAGQFGGIGGLGGSPLDLDVERAHLDHRRLTHLDVEPAP